MNQNLDLQLITGACRVEDAEVTNVGFWRNPALIAANAERDDIPEYKGTWIITLGVAHEDNVDVIQQLAQDGEDLRPTFITAQVHVNGDANPRVPFVGEKIKAATIYPVNDGDGEALMHGERSPLNGRQVYRARLEEFYPPAKAKTINLRTLLSGEEVAEKPEPVTKPSAE